MDGNASTQVTHTNDVQEAIAFAEQYGHECTGNFKIIADEVEFFWDFEDVGSEGVLKMVFVEVDGMKFETHITEAGRYSVPDARKEVKKLAKELGAAFMETTEGGTAAAYRSTLFENLNQYR